MIMIRRFQQSSDSSNHGVTLVEVLLYVSVVAIVLVASSVFYAEILQSRVKNTAILEVDQQGMLVMQTVTQSIRNAEGVTNITPGNSSTVISLDIPADEEPTRFFLSEDRLQVERSGDEPIYLTNDRIIVSELLFQNLSSDGNSDSIRITLTLSHRNPEDRREYSFEKTFHTTATVRQP